MHLSAVRNLLAAGLLMMGSGVLYGQAVSKSASHGPTQQSEKDYADRMRKAPALDMATVFLKHTQMPVLLDQVRHRPNTTITVGSELVTAANVEEYAKRLDRERQILADLIRQRGFTNVAGVYELEKDSRNACHIAPELRGPITIAQDTFSVELNDPANLLALKGVIVESAMAAARSEEAITATFFVGDIANRQIELGMAGAGISCKIGRLLRHGTQPQ